MFPTEPMSPEPDAEDRVVACDVCGALLPMSDRRIGAFDDQVVYYCSEACWERRELADLGDDPDDEQARGVRPAAP